MGRKPTGRVIPVDRVVAGIVPSYCVHGCGVCVRCEHTCWLGHAVVNSHDCPGVGYLCVICVAICARGMAHEYVCFGCLDEVLPGRLGARNADLPLLMDLMAHAIAHRAAGPAVRLAVY